MQTFVPAESYEESARLLDRQRLGKQRLENFQIMQAISRMTELDGLPVPFEPRPSVAKHWVTLMWGRHAMSLWQFQKAVCHEWTAVRGYKDTMLDRTGVLVRGMFYDLSPHLDGQDWGKPAFIGDPEFHAQHRARLVAKDPAFYGPLFPGVEPIEDYDFRWRTDTV